MPKPKWKKVVVGEGSGTTQGAGNASSADGKALEFDVDSVAQRGVALITADGSKQ